MLGIIERTGQISVDNALQYVSDVKEDIDLYEEVSGEEEPQDVQDFYKKMCIRDSGRTVWTGTYRRRNQSGKKLWYSLCKGSFW